MARLEDLKAGAYVRGLSPDGAVKIVQAEWFGDQALKVTFEEPSGNRQIENGFARTPRYVREPFEREPNFSATAGVYRISELLQRSTEPV